MKVAAVNLAKTQVILLCQGGEEAVQQFVGIGTALVDVVARMSARQALHGDAEEKTAFGSLDHGERKFGRCTRASGTADKQLAFVLRIQVNQDIAPHKPFLQRKGTGQAGFVKRHSNGPC